MARRRRAAADSPERPHSALPPAYPSSPNRPGTHVVVAKKEDRYCCLVFAARYAARAFVDLVRDGEGHHQFRKPFASGPMQAHFDSGLIIQVEPTQDLEDLIEGPELEGAEAEFRLTDLFQGQAKIIREGREHPELIVERRPKSRIKRSTGESQSSAVRTPRAQKTGKGPNDFAAHFKTEPGKIRQALRKIMAKPAGGWDFTDDAFNELLPKIAKELKT